MMKQILLLFVLMTCQSAALLAQFPGAAGTVGSTAIHKDSSIFTAWATNCIVVRGPQDIADTSLGYASAGIESMAVGQADGAQVVSLGDGGYAVTTFERPVANGPGFDFAVFENGFIDEFLELGFVEVSSDGINFFRFKATSNTQTDIQVGPFDYNANPTLMNNLAGKYRAMFGTPFDLEELNNIPGLNVNAITHIKVIDVVGSINPMFGTYDQYNQLINDHYPTPFPQGGFDLDAIGVIHQQPASLRENADISINVFPNPFDDCINLIADHNIISIEITNHLGHLVYSKNESSIRKLSLPFLSTGIYFLKTTDNSGIAVVTKLVKY